MREYTVDIGGLEHTLLLDEEEAERRGLNAKPEKKAAPAPANKARGAKNKKG